MLNDSWDEGYAADTTYTFGYYNQLNPLQYKLLFLSKSVAMPKIKTACELGFGQGVTINMHAASSDVEWFGNDFNPEQVAFAQGLADASHAKIHLYDDSFAEFVHRDDLPKFDFIAVHGIWSWISDENKQCLVDFIKKNLKVGGILYISYNTLPGHCKTGPVRKLMSMYNNICVSEALNTTSRVDECLVFANEVVKLSPLLTRDIPVLSEKISSLAKDDHTYLCHEYLNMNWDPMYFDDFAEKLGPAKLSYICSATMVDLLDMVNFSDEHKAMFDVLVNPNAIETYKDFLVDRQFRCDIWGKGVRHLNNVELELAIKDISVILMTDRSKIKLEHEGYCATVNLTNILNPILDILGDYKPHGYETLLKKARSLGFTFNDVLFAIQSLVTQNALCVTQELTPEIRKQALDLNRSILETCVLGPKISNLAAPLIGGSLAFDHLNQIFLLAYMKLGKSTNIKTICDFVDETFNAFDIKILKKEANIQDDNANKEEIRKSAEEFLKRLDLYKTLGIVE